MKNAAEILALLALGAAFNAAWFWWRSSQVPLPHAPAQGEVIRADYNQEMHTALSNAASLNRWAAIWTGIAAVLSTAASLASVLTAQDLS